MEAKTSQGIDSGSGSEEYSFREIGHQSSFWSVLGKAKSNFYWRLVDWIGLLEEATLELNRLIQKRFLIEEDPEKT